MVCLFILLFLGAAAHSEAAEPVTQSCAKLAALALPNTTITLAAIVDSGRFVPPAGGKTFSGLASFCRVTATLKPSSDSDIKIEVWLPVTAWNGKFQAVGNGGWGGAINYSGLSDALRRGYATSATDDGHSGPSGDFVLGHPEKFIDFAYRSEHLMTVQAKTIVHVFYGRGPRHSYWNGCSGGGREGLLEAYRYPGDFDGIIAGDPANFRRNAWAIWLANATFRNSASYIPPSDYPFIHRAVLDVCDAQDGLKDGLIEDPTRCHFDPKVLQCGSGSGSSCLTTPQVEAARAMMSPARSPGGEEIFPRLEPGTELRWARLAGGPAPADLFLDYFKYVVFKDPDWDWRSFHLERDSALADKAGQDVITMNPNLRKFAAHGGKLLIYHGWADQQVAPGFTLEFYRDAVKIGGGDTETSNWLRLFMAPGMAHCSGGEGPDTFDKVNAMERWVEKGESPNRILASHKVNGKVDRTRPLCPYPQIAKYNGAGSIDDAANFTCTE